ncbi:SDR family oxidoreductase [Anianabacter salinae]|uniref:SDR family oxidoreductase n=1 Tax=Anianabacter salinae TaxID=2851023 RepID=UPI00225E23DB|nr:SDR family oxidoreductase [Anianabacter salinae]MBV0910893.1 SDR family oxidoreductase [Anianabacter salinae]
MHVRHALVTGAGQRLGRAMAVYLGSRGYDVAVHFASSGDGAEETADEIRRMGRNTVTLQADLLDEDACAALIPRAMKALGGPVTVLVNNASIFEHDTVQTATKALWDKHIGSNLRAPFVLTQEMARHVPDPVPDDMGEPVAQALVVNMVDQRVRKLTPHFMTYTIAKMGLWAFTQTAARGLAPRVRVNAIGPGPTLQGDGQSEAGYARQRSSTVLRRGSNPSDICGALGYFLDAPGVTGQLLCVDGGQHLAWQTPDVSDLD